MARRRPRPIPPPPALDDATLEAVAQLSSALGSVTRLRILLRLWRSEATVLGLAADIGMSQSALSHQLQVLRGLDLVRPARTGQSVIYRLRDGHVALMLGEAIRHTEHVRFGDDVGDDASRPVASDPVAGAGAHH